MVRCSAGTPREKQRRHAPTQAALPRATRHHSPVTRRQNRTATGICSESRDGLFAKLLRLLCAGHPQADTLAGLIYLLAHSTLFDHFCLMTSIPSGFDRQTFNKKEFDALPFPDVADLSERDKATIRSLTSGFRLTASDRGPTSTDLSSSYTVSLILPRSKSPKTHSSRQRRIERVGQR